MNSIKDFGKIFCAKFLQAFGLKSAQFLQAFGLSGAKFLQGVGVDVVDVKSDADRQFLDEVKARGAGRGCRGPIDAHPVDARA